MRASDFTTSSPGVLVQIPRPKSAQELLELDGANSRPSHIDAFLPNPLPPEIQYTPELVNQIGRAMLAVGRLDTKADDLANPLVLIRPLLNHEALASSKIEGTRADFDTLVVYQNNQVLPQRDSDVPEVANYVSALRYAIEQPEDRDISIYVIRELHRILLDGVRGSHLDPGNLRTNQVVIGLTGDRAEDASYVPPPAFEVQPLLLDLERYINAEDVTPPLIRIALTHYQFEAIHPFNDGNGRVGRLLIALLLKRWRVMKHPCLDLSAYVLKHRGAYISALQQISTNGNWANWFEFFVGAIELQAQDALRRSELLLALRDRYLQRLRASMRLDVEPIVDRLFMDQRLTSKTLQTELGLPAMTAHRTIDKLVDLRIVTERSGRQRGRVFVASEIISILDTTV